MNPLQVQMIGVFDCTPPQENFTYTLNLPAPWNLWMQAKCSDGSRMGPHFMGFVLNELMAGDLWNEGDSVEIADQSGVKMRALVKFLVPSREVEAFAAQTEQVRVVEVEVIA
jgi:hypothetical protein